jgi:hypothetical protein
MRSSGKKLKFLEKIKQGVNMVIDILETILFYIDKYGLQALLVFMFIGLICKYIVVSV